MREYELTVVYDLAVAEAGGPEAGPQRLSTLVEARGGKMLKVDHWGRRRMAYPIGRAIDGDYVVTRVDLDPGSVGALEAALKIDEKVYRHLVVRADELPPPPPPREPREQREPRPMAEAPAEAPAPAAEAPAAADAPEAVADAAEAVAEAAVAEAAPAAVEPAAAAEEPAEAAADEEAPAEE